MSRDVVFDESASWYIVDSASSNPVENEFDTDMEEDYRLRLTLEVSVNLNQVEWTTRASKRLKHVEDKPEVEHQR